MSCSNSSTPFTSEITGDCNDFDPLVNLICEILVVGGTYLPIDTTSLLLAGASVNVWMIPVVMSAAGFGILIARKI